MITPEKTRSKFISVPRAYGDLGDVLVARFIRMHRRTRSLRFVSVGEEGKEIEEYIGLDV